MYKQDTTIESRAIDKLTKLVEKYGAEFRDKTSKTDGFPQIDEIEQSWEGLRKQSSEVIRDMVNELMNDVNERELIAKKKRSGGTAGSS